MSGVVEIRDLFEGMLKRVYSSEGLSECVEYRTSMELAYEFRNSVSVSLLDVSVVMRRAGYKLERFGGEPKWRVYIVND